MRISERNVCPNGSSHIKFAQLQCAQSWCHRANSANKHRASGHSRLEDSACLQLLLLRTPRHMITSTPTHSPLAHPSPTHLLQQPVRLAHPLSLEPLPSVDRPEGKAQLVFSHVPASTSRPAVNCSHSRLAHKARQRESVLPGLATMAMGPGP